jgi:hypothetical protein
MFDRIHCSFSWFIDEFDWYSSVGDFTVHIFNQIDFNQFLPNFTKFNRFFKKPTESRGTDFVVSTQFFKH